MSRDLIEAVARTEVDPHFGDQAAYHSTSRTASHPRSPSGMALELVSPTSGYAFFRAPARADALAAAAALGARPEVKGAEVGVREAFDEAQ